jgi:hypothetical protein
MHWRMRWLSCSALKRNISLLEAMIVMVLRGGGKAPCALAANKPESGLFDYLSAAAVTVAAFFSARVHACILP